MLLVALNIFVFTFLFILVVPTQIYLLSSIWTPKWIVARQIKLNWEAPRPLREATWTSFTVVILSAPIFLVLFVESKMGYSVRYQNFYEIGWLYFFVATIESLIIIDTYFYWLHRLFHLRKIKIHFLHHTFRNPTPFGAFAMHPIEAILHALIYLPLLLIIPWHWYTYALISAVNLTWNSVLHSGVEFVPPNGLPDKLFKYFMTTRNHSRHHDQADGNFGLYFNYWDRMMGTYRD